MYSASTIEHSISIDTCVVKVSACQETGPAGAADGGGGKGVGKFRPALGNQLPGRLQGCGAAHSDVLVIRQDHHDVGPPLAPRHADAEDEGECHCVS